MKCPCALPPKARHYYVHMTEDLTPHVTPPEFSPTPARSTDAGTGTGAAPRYARVLTIAGSDSGGGAGVQADLKTFAALGCYGMTAITAITAQNTRGVSAIHSVPPDILQAQLDAVLDDIGADAIKIGMLHTPQTVRVVADTLSRYPHIPVVLDPVMVATSGDRLISQDSAQLLVHELFSLSTIVTPNLDEAAWLLGHPLPDVPAMQQAAQALLRMGTPGAVLLKGGHLRGDEVADVFADARTGTGQVLTSRHIATRNSHGTGCTLAAAIAAHLALGFALTDAVHSARVYVRAALAAGAQVVTGGGHGPLNHGYAPLAQMVLRA